jgi:hypothetical protein
MNDFVYEPIDQAAQKAFYKIYFDTPVNGLSKSYAVIEVVSPQMNLEKMKEEDIIFSDAD